jgi:predicted enzyme related to lactoylglutathione lyase
VSATCRNPAGSFVGMVRQGAGPAPQHTEVIMPSPIVHAEIRSTDLGGSIVQEPVRVPGVAFALIADPAGQVVGLAQQG